MRILASVFSILLAVSLSERASSAEPVSLRADIWCPYNCAPDDAERGYMVDVATRVFAQAGLDVDYRLVNWSRAIRLTERGEIDGIIGATRDEVPSFLFPDEPLGWSRDAYFVAAGDPWRYGGPRSLAHKRIGLIQDYDYTEMLANLPGTARVEYASGDQPLLVNLRKLKAGRIDVIVSDENVARLKLRMLNRSNEVTLAGREPRSDRDALHIAFSPRRDSSRRYAKLLSDGIMRLRRSGELAQILARYGLRDWVGIDPSNSVSMRGSQR